MIIIRKIIVWLIAVAVVVAAFNVYNHFSRTPEIQSSTGTSEEDLQVPDRADRQIMSGDPIIENVQLAEFIDYDEQGNAKRIWGYQAVHKPDPDSTNWKLTKPYMTMFDGDSRYRIDADRATVRVETAAGKTEPTDAVLTEHVVINIRSTDESGVTEANIYMDDLVYNSYRSEFSTDGPVRLASENAEMVGTGLVMLYNPILTRIEYLRIVDLDYLLIRDVSGFSSQTGPADGADSTASTAESAIGAASTADHPADMSDDSLAQTTSPAGQQQSQPQTAAVSEEKQAPADDGAGPADTEKPQNYYFCQFKDDVVIEYGQQFVVVGAQEVNINNILWSSKPSSQPDATAAADAAADTDTQMSDTGQTASSETGRAGDEPIASAKLPAGASADTAGDEPGGDTLAESRNNDSAVDVIIRCQGGVIVKPVEPAQASGTAQRLPRLRTAELTGSPVEIKQKVKDGSENFKTVAACAMLTYNMDTEVLDMFTSAAEKYISLADADSETHLETAGTVTWNRNANKALITGPGKLFMHPDKNSSSDDRPAEMSFGGLMKLFFAENRLADSSTSLVLKSVNLTGGMEAAIHDENASHVLADSAVLNFAPNSDIESTVLDGNVVFNSTNGNLSSRHAEIFFAKAPDGKVAPVSMRTTGNPVIHPAASRNPRQPDRFAARIIDYDMTTGNALAHGPVNFTFYVSDPNATDLTVRLIPVVITADKNAEFLADENRTVNRIIFNENVVGTRIQQLPAYVQKSTFTGDRLIVDLAGDNPDGADIEHITIDGENVQLNSIRSVDETAISNVRLLCQQIDYYEREGLVVATGPGNIEIDNSKAPPLGEGRSQKLAMDGPCYGRIVGFSRLKWFTQAGNIVADGSESKQVDIRYLPVVDGGYGQLITATATQIRAAFAPTPTGRNRLDSINTTGGLYYREAGGHELIGETLDFDAGTAMMTIKGTEKNPCFADGASVPKIEYNLQSGTINTTLSTTPAFITIPE